MQRYIGLDVHANSCTAAMIDGRGKRLGSQVIETNGKALVEFFKLQPGEIHLCLEEGTQSGWLVELLTPHVSKLVVMLPAKRKGSKNDRLDAFGLAEDLRRGAIDVQVFKQVGPFGELRQLVKTHLDLVGDTRRAQNRIKALYRSFGIPTSGSNVYAQSSRDMWLKKLPKSNRSSAEIQYAHYDSCRQIRDIAKKNLVISSHRHSITKVLETCPGMGEIRVARFVATVVSPYRFRGRRQFCSYCGLGIVMRSSSDWFQFPDGNWQKLEKPMTRGLNRNFNRILKDVFKGAASSVIMKGGDEPLYLEYIGQTEKGTKPNLAKVTLARKLAFISLTMWKNKEEYDPKKRLKEYR